MVRTPAGRTAPFLRASCAALILLAVCAGPVRAQQLRFKHLTPDDGLSRSWVPALLQDRLGFVERVGRPAAVRAVGAANGRNPLPIVVPCHRVVGSDGTLTGYAGGLPVKRALLALEGLTFPEVKPAPRPQMTLF